MEVGGGAVRTVEQVGGREVCSGLINRLPYHQKSCSARRVVIIVNLQGKEAVEMVCTKSAREVNLLIAMRVQARSPSIPFQSINFQISIILPLKSHMDAKKKKEINQCMETGSKISTLPIRFSTPPLILTMLEHLSHGIIQLKCIMFGCHLHTRNRSRRRCGFTDLWITVKERNKFRRKVQSH